MFHISHSIIIIVGWEADKAIIIIIIIINVITVIVIIIIIIKGGEPGQRTLWLRRLTGQIVGVKQGRSLVWTNKIVFVADWYGPTN